MIEQDNKTEVRKIKCVLCRKEEPIMVQEDLKQLGGYTSSLSDEWFCIECWENEPNEI